MLKKVSLALALCLSVGYSQVVNYPYPQRKLYRSDMINVRNSTADDDLKERFKDYISNFYAIGTCSGSDGGGWTGKSGTCARIKFTDPKETSKANETVSEGIGYAMLMAVYFSDKTKSYQTEFDNLWRYYKAHTNNNGLMNWRIQGFGTVLGTGSATDAEYDAALALAMARYQFGDIKYENDAKTLIGKIWQHEMETDGFHKPGDSWNDVKNPSYVAPAAFEIFKDLGTSSNWTAALAKNYTFLKANQNSTTGLPSGWANSSGNPVTCTNNCGNNTANYDMDGVRAPWRWATAYAWFGHSDAKTLLTKLGSWVNGLQPAAVQGPIALNGNMGTDANAGYIGSLMNALSINSTYQSKMNSFWSTMSTKNDASYFNQSLFILTALLASGNMPNLKACASSSGCGTTMPEISTGTGIPLDKLSIAGSESLEDRGFAKTWEPWYAYTDKDADDSKGGKAQSTITNDKFTSLDENANCKEIESYRVVLEESGEYAVRIKSYTLKQGTYLYEPFVGLGLSARNNGKTGAGGYSLANCTGFSYEFKGSAHKFKVQTTAIEEGSGKDHFKIITPASTSAWKSISVPNDELAQPTWVDKADLVGDLSPGKIYAFAWELVGSDGASNAISESTGSLAIKNFRCVGSVTLSEEKPVSKCNPSGGTSSSSVRSSSSVSTGGASSSSRGSSSSVSGGTSSSSRGSSSSVSTGGASSSSRGSSSSAGSVGGTSSSSRGSSSSVGGDGGTSSSDGNGEDTSSSSSDSVSPVILSQAVFSNGLNAMQNAVNLQAAGNATVQIFDLKGNEIRKFSFTKGNYVVSMADLSRGLYLVKASSGGWKQTVTVPIK